MRYHLAGTVVACALVGALHAQTPGGDSRFEVASVKPSNSSLGDTTWQVAPTRFTARNFQLDAYLRFAFSVSPARLVAPQSIRRAQFDIVATGSDLNKPEILKAAMQRLLSDRFALRWHRENRPIEVMSLVLSRTDGKLGPNLTRVSVDCADSKNAGACVSVGLACGVAPCVARTGTEWSRIDLAGMLTTSDRLVIDKTGLSGQFDLLMRWRSDRPEDASKPDFVDRPLSIEDAVREQLGLKLIPARETMEVVVIDNVQPPTPD